MRLPTGTRDWLPAELRRKRAVEHVLRGVFERWAYNEVQTPNFERFDALEAGLGETIATKLFLFADKTGTQCALRPEMTTPVARLVSTRMREADAESLFTAIEAMDALGLGDTHFDINHGAIVDGVLAGLELAPHAVARAKTLMSGRNIVELRQHLAGSGSERDVDAIVELAMTRGRANVLASATALCRTDAGFAGIERLRTLLARADELGFAARIDVDCALLRDITYYTGFIFEGFVNDVGFALCGGGRYDALLPSFGFAAGAVGWSLAVERILIALERRHSAFGDAPAIDVLVSGSDVVAARERAAGRIVRIDFERLTESELLAEARRQHIPRVVIASDGHVRELEVPA